MLVTLIVGKPIINLEVDLIIVSKNSILLIEIKSSPKDVFSAMNQLNRAEAVVTEINKALCESQIVCVKKIIVIPPYKQRDLTMKAKHNNVTVIFGHVEDNLSDLAKNEKCPNPSQEIQGLVLNLVHYSDNEKAMSPIFDQNKQDNTTPPISGDF
jgi:hypothetical protein